MIRIFTTAAPQLTFTSRPVRLDDTLAPGRTLSDIERSAIVRECLTVGNGLYQDGYVQGAFIYPVAAMLRYTDRYDNPIGRSEIVWLSHPSDPVIDPSRTLCCDGDAVLTPREFTCPSYRIHLQIEPDADFSRVYKAELLITPQILPYDVDARKASVSLSDGSVTVIPGGAPVGGNADSLSRIAQKLSAGWGYEVATIYAPFERGCDLTVKYPANYADVHEQTMLRQIMRGEGHLVRAIAYRAATCDLSVYGSAIAPAVETDADTTETDHSATPIHHKTHRRRITKRVASYQKLNSRYTPPPVAVRPPPQPP